MDWMGFGQQAGSMLGQFGMSLIGDKSQQDWATGMAHGSEDFQRSMWQKNYEMQKEFAQNGLTWKIQDAARSGISPLAALGASGYSASPMMVGSNIPNVDRASSYHELGQNLGRAILAQQSQQDKENHAIDMARKRKENDLLDLQIASARNELNKHATNPGIPNSFQYMRNPDGSVEIQPSSEFSQANAGNLVSPMTWYMKNKLLPYVMPNKWQGVPSYVQEYPGGPVYEHYMGTNSYYLPGADGSGTYLMQGR